MSERVDDHTGAGRRLLAAVVMTFAGWLVAFLVVAALFFAFGDGLASLPPVLRALIISGVLVSLMLNVVMPPLSAAVRRWVVGSSRDRPGGADPLA